MLLVKEYIDRNHGQHYSSIFSSTRHSAKSDIASGNQYSSKSRFQHDDNVGRPLIPNKYIHHLWSSTSDTTINEDTRPP